MRHNKKRVIKMSEELTAFLLRMGATEIESKLQREAGHYRLTYRADYTPACRGELEELKEYLNLSGRFGAVEEYWVLAGSSDMGDGSELLLIGMMTEQADIQLTDTQVELKLMI